MKAFYTDGRDISGDEVLEEIAEEVGLNLEEFAQELKDPKWESMVYEETRQAQEVFGISSLPAVVVQNRYLVEGAVPIAHYKQVIEKVKTSLPVR